MFVESEWARLREVIVGRPFLRIPRPFPRSLRPRLGDHIWSLIKAREGDLLADAFPQLQSRVRNEMDEAASVLRRHGVVVREVPPFEREEEPGDQEGGFGAFQYFARDSLLVVGTRVIELATRGADRYRELLPIRRLLDTVLARRGARRVVMSPLSPGPERASRRALLEGGDCLLTPDELFVGLSGHGSNRAGIAWLRRMLRDERALTVVPVASAAVHLDVALCLVRPGLGIRCRALLPAGVPASLRSWEWVEVPRRQALESMAVNCLPIDAGTTLVPAGLPRLAEGLTRRGQCVLATPFSTVIRHAGGLRCWSQPLSRID